MRKLSEIVRVVGRKRLKRIEIFNEGGVASRGNLYYKFYKGIKDGRYLTDEDAARDLFGTEPSDKKYLMLKSRVKTRLINTLFFLERSKSRYQQAIYKCNRNLVAARYLLLNDANDSASAILKSTLHESEKYHLTNIALDCLRELRYRASFSGNEAEHRKYNERFKQVQKLLAAEFKSEEYYQLITLPFAKSHISKQEFASQAFAYIKKIEALREEGSTYSLEINYFRLRVIANQIAIMHKEVIKTCQEAEDYLNDHSHLVQKIRFGEFAFYRMVAYLHLGEYEEGHATAQRALGKKLYREGSLNWMIFLEYYFLLCMHTFQYQKALEIYGQVVGHPRFPHIDATRREKWRIFHAFLKYMITDETSNTAEAKQARFNIWKFLNEVPIFSKDKRGLNIAILILQVLFLLDRKDFDGIIQRAEALKVYASRYLKRDENFRSNCFLKMLLIMERKDFNYERTRDIASKYYAKLKSEQFNYQSGKLANLEIIPYEQLWERILSKLKA